MRHGSLASWVETTGIDVGNVKLEVQIISVSDVDRSKRSYHSS
jgi:hypothetical protein